MTRARRLMWTMVTLVGLTLVSTPPVSALPIRASVPVAGHHHPSARLMTTTPRWRHDIRAVIGDRPVSVAIGRGGDRWFGHLGWVARPPASNEKLLLSMALFDRYAPSRTIATQAKATARPDTRGVIHGDLWIVGHGDPEIDQQRTAELAKAIVGAGVRAIRGSVNGDTGPFVRDWWAKGWKDYFPKDYIPLPTALTYGQNTAHGVHITDPERRAARRLTDQLEHRGVAVRGDPQMGRAPTGLARIATTASEPLRTIIRHMDVRSRNFYAEVLGKRLGFDESGRGTIAAGARAIERFTHRHGQDFTSYDSSGLSYANRATTKGILDLLWDADAEPWGRILRASLPKGGQGTLEDRFANITIHAKTGTLDDASALSGWVRLQATGRWVEFSILSSGFNEWTAKTIEDRIVHIISFEASDPTP